MTPMGGHGEGREWNVNLVFFISPWAGASVLKEHLIGAGAGLVLGLVIAAVVILICFHAPISLDAKMREAHPDRDVFLFGKNRYFRDAYEYLTGEHLRPSLSNYYLAGLISEQGLEIWDVSAGRLRRRATFSKYEPAAVKRAFSRQGSRRWETINVHVRHADRDGWLWLLIAQVRHGFWIRNLSSAELDVLQREWEGRDAAARF
jgi:hypothetical protein